MERGAVLTTPQQLHADLEVTRQQLRKALETVEKKSKELDIRKCRETEIEGLEKNLKNIIKAEKDKRLHLEERITTRLEKTGVVVLERGVVLATPQQISLHADLEVTSQQLRKALETVEEKSSDVFNLRPKGPQLLRAMLSSDVFNLYAGALHASVKAVVDFTDCYPVISDRVCQIVLFAL